MAEEPESSSGFSVNKRVDESWKETVQKEKKSVPGTPKEKNVPPGPNPNFPYFVSSLGMQALLALGEIPDPDTGEKRADLGQARHLIDIIQMLQDKTKGNLSKEEAQMLSDLVYELQMKFVSKSGAP